MKFDERLEESGPKECNVTVTWREGNNLPTARGVTWRESDFSESSALSNLTKQRWGINMQPRKRSQTMPNHSKTWVGAQIDFPS